MKLCPLLIVAIFVVFLAQNVASFSKQIHRRGKRISDQRLAELETLAALSKFSGRIVKVPIGFGKVDPERIGRKRRSQSSIFLDKLLLETSKPSSDNDRSGGDEGAELEDVEGEAFE